MYKEFGCVFLYFRNNLWGEDIQEALRYDYKPCFGCELLPRLFIKNTYGSLYIAVSFLLWRIELLWFKQCMVEYDVQGGTKTTHKGIRYYLSFGLWK